MSKKITKTRKFSELPYGIQEKHYESAQKRINANDNPFKGKFECFKHSLLGSVHCIDFTFLGLKKPTVWSGRIISLTSHYNDIISEQVERKWNDLGISDKGLIISKSANESEGKVRINSLIASKRNPKYKPLEQLSGLTYPQWKHSSYQLLADSGTITVNESVVLNDKYPDATYLVIHKSIGVITANAIEQFIDEFRSKDEKIWVGHKAYTFTARTMVDNGFDNYKNKS